MSCARLCLAVEGLDSSKESPAGSLRKGFSSQAGCREGASRRASSPGVLNLLHWEPGGLRLHGLRSGRWPQKCLGTPISDGDRVPVEPSKIIRHLVKLNLYINSNNKNRTNPIKRSREEICYFLGLPLVVTLAAPLTVPARREVLTCS